MREAFQVGADFKPYTERKPLPKLLGVNKNNARHMDALNLTYIHMLKNDIESHNFFLNLSQGVGRKPWGRLRTFCGSSELYDFERECVVLPVEQFALMGIPVQELGMEPNTELQSLLGNSVFLPCLSTVLVAYFFNSHGPWWNPGSAASTQETGVGSSTATTRVRN